MGNFFELKIGQGVKSEAGTWYKVVQFLGLGGNAITYLVFSTIGPNKGALFALKVFRVVSKPERKAKFLRERQFLYSSCSHPSIMRVFDAGVFSAAGAEYPFVISEYLPNTLREVIRGKGAPVVKRVSYSIQLLSALAYLDSLPNPVIHRDIKPENIFLKGETCVLGDFGLMRFVDAQEEEDREVLMETTGRGMPYYYRTPDLVAYARGESSITTKSDVFQAGLVIAELFTGRNPAKPPSEGILTSPLEMEDLGRIHSALGAGIATLVKRMLTHDAQARPSASDLLDGWCGVFEEAVQRANELDGRAF